MDLSSGRVHTPGAGSGLSGGRGAAAVFLIGLGGAWCAGNVGPVVSELARELDASLASVGLLSGTALIASMVLMLPFAPALATRVGLTRALAIGAGLGAVGNLVFAVGEDFAVLTLGRLICGAGLGIAGGLGPVLARTTGGVGRVGLFGASFQLGIAGGLGLGSVLADVGADWRLGFVIAALVVASPIPLLAGQHIEAEEKERTVAFLPLAVRSPDAWRLAVLFVALFTVPLTLAAWLVHYLVEFGDVRPALAGALAFLLFGASALLREVGGSLSGRGVSAFVLTGLTPCLAVGGLVAVGLDPALGVGLAAVLLMAAGFALPYATMMVEAQRLFPPDPAQPTSFLTMIGGGLSIATVPIVGSLLAADRGELAFAALGVIVALGAVLNLRPAGRPLAE